MTRIGQTRLEWILLAVIAAVCAGLSLLQYRWTGELRQAETVTVRAGLEERARGLARTFDEEIRESVNSLLPTADELRQQGLAASHKGRYERWMTSHERSLFTRFGVVAPDEADHTLHLYSIDSAGTLVPMEWPSSWEGLRQAMAARANGVGPLPMVPRDSMLVETALLEGRGGQVRELEWMIFDVNPDYVRTKILPRLVAEYLNPEGAAEYDVSVSWSGAAGPALFSTRIDGASVARGADETIGLFATVATDGPRGRRGGHPHGGKGRMERDGDHDGDHDGPRPRWTMAVRHQAGSLDAAVSRAQSRNLVISFALIALLGGTAGALVRYTARSRRLSDMQFRFVAGVSHDLRTPLTAIRAAAYNLAEGVLTEPAAIRRYAQLIERNSEELTAMIENVLAYSASRHANRTDRRESFAVGELLAHATAAMSHEIEQAGCRVELTVEPGLPPVTGDSVALEQAFRNLIGNAVRHASEGKWIGVSAARSGDGVEVRVCDRGPGIPDEELGRIFEPFYRGGRTRQTQIRGTGLGLSLVKEAVERHRGTIRVGNSPGGGAEFTLHLPVVPEGA